MEDNRLIAEFMGYKFEEKQGQNGHVRYTIIKPGEKEWFYGTWEKPALDQYLTEGFRYHSSWDWLMPVVEKIEYDHGNLFKIEGYTCEVTASANENPREKPFRIFHHTNSKISAAYAAVVEFIKWYNQQK